MKQATSRKKLIEPPPIHMNKRLQEGGLILFISLAIYLMVALITYHQEDSSWSHSGMSEAINNAAGKTGAWFSDILFSVFGYSAFVFPFALASWGVFIYRNQSKTPMPTFVWSMRAIGLLFSILASCGLSSLYWQTSVLDGLPMNSGGILGSLIHHLMVNYLSQMGATIFLLMSLLIGTTLFGGISWLKVFKQIGIQLFQAFQLLKEKIKARIENQKEEIIEDLPQLTTVKNNKILKPKTKKESFFGDEISDLPDALLEDELLPFPVKPKKAKISKQNLSTLFNDNKEEVVESFQNNFSGATPSLELLEIAEKNSRPGYNHAQLNELSQLVENRLSEFGVEVKVVGAHPGPVITRFELNLAAGIKASKITGLAKDIARSLSISSVRVVEVIPGKSVVGLEIPNLNREMVRLKEILEDKVYQQASSPITLALGKDISGRPIVVDLAKMPHLLVAGTTGSGKSVGINAMLLSILYKSTPQEVRLILIDPKMLELSVYDNIPHLLTPVVTDMKDAANALRWCVAEMERRYQLMAAMGVRNLASYNDKINQSATPIMDPLWNPQKNPQPESLTALPFVVVVVDEFADMMMVVGKKVEELIARIAQKARAAGIHLILATQRPSVDVITGLIKANIPTRISFQVSSRIDSRTILDQMGAEQLLGHGDMLYLPPGVGIPHRIHGAFVSDEEVHKVANEWRKTAKPQYLESITSAITQSSIGSDSEDYDELYDSAVSVVTQERKASISLVQRRLKIGYNRAARLIEQMEAQGIVSSLHNNGTREVLAPAVD